MSKVRSHPSTGVPIMRKWKEMTRGIEPFLKNRSSFPNFQPDLDDFEQEESFLPQFTDSAVQFEKPACQNFSQQSEHVQHILTSLEFLHTAVGCLTKPIQDSKVLVEYIRTLSDFISTIYSQVSLLNNQVDNQKVLRTPERKLENPTISFAYIPRTKVPPLVIPENKSTLTPTVSKSVKSPPRKDFSRNSTSPNRPRIPKLTLTPTREEQEEEQDTQREIQEVVPTQVTKPPVNLIKSHQVLESESPMQVSTFDCEHSFENNMGLSTAARLIEHSQEFKDLDVSIVSDHQELVFNQVSNRKQSTQLEDINSTSMVIEHPRQRLTESSNTADERKRQSRSVCKRTRILASSKTIFVEPEEKEPASFRTRAQTLPTEPDVIKFLEEPSPDVSNDILSLGRNPKLKELLSISGESDHHLYSEIVTLFSKQMLNDPDGDSSGSTKNLILAYNSRVFG